MAEEFNYEAQVKAILDESKSDITRQIKDAIKQRIVTSLDWSVGSEITTFVKKYIEEYMSEDIKQEVLNCKPEILAAVREVMVGAGASIAKAMTEKVQKTMADSWKAEKVLKGLFE